MYFRKCFLAYFVVVLCIPKVLNALEVQFTPSATTMYIGNIKEIYYAIIVDTWDDSNSNGTCLVTSENSQIVYLRGDPVLLSPNVSVNGSFFITGNFLGRTTISCNNLISGGKLSSLEVVVLREPRVIDTIFTVSVVLLVSLVSINFGCSMDWSKPKEILKKPVGPIVGFCGQFVFMPLLSYGLGKFIFPDHPEMQLGLFFTGISPGGGASNIWTALFDGNLGLSLIMSAVGNLCAFFMMPLWLFTLGRLIFESAQLEVPYTQIVSYIMGLLVPLGIGYLIQRYQKRVADVLIRWSKYIMTFVLVFIVVFAIFTNLYLFELFSWQIIFAGVSLPWIGYIFGYLLAKLLGQCPKNCTAIALEIGIENTGIAIFLLRFALPQPEVDLTTVIPVSISMVTPLPLAVILIYKKISQRFSRKSYSISILNGEI